MAEVTTEGIGVKDLLSDPSTPIARFVEARSWVHASLARRSPLERLLAEFGREVARALPTESAAETRRGVLQWMLGYVELAAQTLEAARSSQERNFFLGMALLEMDRLAAACEPLGNAYEAARDEGVVAKAYAEALARSGQADAAGKVVARIEKERERDPDVAYLWGLIHDARGDLYAALEKFEEALDIDPAHPKAMFRIAAMQDLKGEDARAMELYQQLRSMRPTYLNAMVNLGVLYEDRGEYEKAIECYKSVLEFFPSHPRARLYMSDAVASLEMYFDEETAKREAKLRQLLQQPLVDFQWPRRVREAFNKIGVTTVGELAAQTEEELLEVPNFGRTSLNEVKKFLAQRGLSLAYAEKSGGQVTRLEMEPEVLDRTLGDLEWSEAALELFRRRGLQSLADLVRLTVQEVLQEKGVGPALVRELQDRLATLGLRLREA